MSKHIIVCSKCDSDYVSGQADGCPYCAVILLQGKCIDIKAENDHLKECCKEIGLLKQKLWPSKDAQIARWKFAFENMRDFAKNSGLNIECVM